MTATTDKNLLFASLAFQLDFVSQDQFVAALIAWSTEKQTPLIEILERQGSLSATHRKLLEPLVVEHLEKDLNTLLSSLGNSNQTDDRFDDDTPDPSTDFSTIMPPGDTKRSDLRFQVLRLHAKGGLGEVFVANDSDLNREVALKQIKLRYADNSDSRSRFIREAEITGGLEHPGVVPVYGLGAYPDGRPYYAMRFIRGQTMHEAIKAFYSEATEGSRLTSTTEGNLELRRLLLKFIAVCETIGFAHSRGVLHRDIKPGNIMLGKFGETLVVDWGLAKVVDQEDVWTGSCTAPPPSVANLSPQQEYQQTNHGDVLGTPSYMSPEQASGRLDLIGPASDIFSLGAVLYEIIAGTPPYVADTVKSTLQLAQAVTFRRPRTANPSTPSSLEAICMKAMSAVPSDRYQSARSLAADLENFLADEPIKAMPPTVSDRLARFARKHRQWLLTGGVAMALLTTVIFFAYFQQSRLAQANANLAVAAKAAQSEAENSLADLQIANQKTQHALTLARQSEENAIKQSELANKATQERQQALELEKKSSEKATVLYRQANEARDSEAKAREKAEELRYKAERLAEFLLGATLPDDPTRFTGAVFFAPKVNWRSYTVRELLNDQYRRAVTELPESSLAQAAVFDSIGDMCRQLTMFDDAERILKNALEIREKNLSADDPDLATSHFHLASYYHERGRFSEAKELYLKAIRIREKIPNGKRALSEVLHNLAWLHYAERSAKLMEETFLRSINMREEELNQKTSDPFSTNHSKRARYSLTRDVVYAKLGMAAAHAGLGQFVRAKQIVTDRKTKEQLIEIGEDRQAEALELFMKANDVLFDNPKAIQFLKECTKILEKEQDWFLASVVYYTLGEKLKIDRQFKEAEEAFSVTFEAFEGRGMYQLPEQSSKVREFTDLLVRNGKKEMAHEIWRKYLKAQEFRFTTDHEYYKQAEREYEKFKQEMK